MKATYFFQALEFAILIPVPESSASNASVPIATVYPVQKLDECCVSTTEYNVKIGNTPWTCELASVDLLLGTQGFEVYGPTNADSPVSAPAIGNVYDLLRYFNTPCAFTIMDNRASDKQSVIFDTGASLANTHEKSDFDGPLTVPKGDLHLGGMAYGLKIEGFGSVTWTFSNGDGADVCIRGMAYSVPKAKARLLALNDCLTHLLECRVNTLHFFVFVLKALRR